MLCDFPLVRQCAEGFEPAKRVVSGGRRKGSVKLGEGKAKVRELKNFC